MRRADLKEAQVEYRREYLIAITNGRLNEAEELGRELSKVTNQLERYDELEGGK